MERFGAQFGGKVTGTGAVGKSRQGAAVSLNEKGTRLLVGGYQALTTAKERPGYLNKQTAAGIDPTPKLVGTAGGSSAWQGYSVSLSADGDAALIGGPSDNTLGGAAWIFSLHRWQLDSAGEIGRYPVGWCSPVRDIPSP
jgi:hypothetical protein